MKHQPGRTIGFRWTYAAFDKDGLGGRVDIAARPHELTMLHVAQTPTVMDLLKGGDPAGIGQRRRGVRGIERRRLGNLIHLRRHIPSLLLHGRCRVQGTHLAPADCNRPVARLELDRIDLQRNGRSVGDDQRPQDGEVAQLQHSKVVPVRPKHLIQKVDVREPRHDTLAQHDVIPQQDVISTDEQPVFHARSA